MKLIIKNITGRAIGLSRYLTVIVMLVFAGDALAVGAGSWGEAFTRTAENISPGASLAMAVAGLIGIIFAIMCVLGFFKKNQPVEFGKQIGLAFGAMVLLSLTWFISTTSTSVAGSDQTSTMQDIIIDQ